MAIIDLRKSEADILIRSLVVSQMTLATYLLETPFTACHMALLLTSSVAPAIKLNQFVVRNYRMYIVWKPYAQTAPEIMIGKQRGNRTQR